MSHASALPKDGFTLYQFPGVFFPYSIIKNCTVKGTGVVYTIMVFWNDAYPTEPIWFGLTHACKSCSRYNYAS